VSITSFKRKVRFAAAITPDIGEDSTAKSCRSVLKGAIALLTSLW
jgi:hypothetical protein